MKILAIDTASSLCSVAILEDENVIKELHTNDDRTHSIKLMPLIQDIFNKTNLKLTDIDLLACNKGPGSFTGIRIGISTIKAFSDVTNLPTVGVSSLESLAYCIPNEEYICSIIDAKNNNAYCGIFEFKNNKYIKINDFFMENINNILSFVKTINKKIIFVGNGSIVYKDVIELILKENAQFINVTSDATHIGKCAFNKYILGKYGSSNTLIPLYLKKSNAEIVLEDNK